MGVGKMPARWTRHVFEVGVWNLPEGPGCYVVFGDDTPVYVGASRALRKRILSYRIRFGYGSSILTPWGAFRRVAIKCRLSQRYGDWAMIELRLIRRLQPKFNVLHNNPVAGRSPAA